MKKIFIPLMILALSVLNSLPMYSFSGWNLIDGEYVYLNNEGQKLQNAWMKSGDNVYYLGSDGFIVKNAIFEYDNELVFVDKDGKKVTNTFMYIDNSVVKPEGMKEGLYYFDERGCALRKTNEFNFKKYIDGVYYAFDEDGLLQEGWFNKEGERLTDEAEYFTEGMYYTDGLGRLLQNKWYNFSEDLGAYVSEEPENDISASSYADMKSLWMYFDNTCKKVSSTDGNIKHREVNGIKYAFDNNGVMVEGFTQNGTLSLEQPSNPSLTESVKLYSFEDGAPTKNQWSRVVPSKSLSQDDFYDDIASWYYTDDSNNIVYNKLKNVKGEKYVFDGVGRMKTGFGLTDGKGLFVANYKPEDLTRDDFVYSITEGSHLNGSELSDLRFFELDDNGKMITGKRKIELADGIFEFCFKNTTGIAYGNKHTMKKHENAYYINGLKLTPLEDMKYGIVKVSDTEYNVVTSNGKIVKGKRRLIKDDYDNTMVILNDKLAGYITTLPDKVKLKWRKDPIDGISNDSGYYYYNSNQEVKKYTAIAVPVGTTCPTPAQLKNIPKDMKVNFR